MPLRLRRQPPSQQSDAPPLTRVGGGGRPLGAGDMYADTSPSPHLDVAPGEGASDGPEAEKEEGRRDQWWRRRDLLHEWENDDVCFVPSDVGDGPTRERRLSPSDLDYYRVLHDYLRSNEYPESLSSRVGSVEVVRPQSFPEDSPLPGGPPSELAILRASSVLAFSTMSLNERGNGTDLVPRGQDGKQVYGDLAGFLLGIHHFNNGDGTVVREIAGINDTCPVRFVADFYDSESVQTTAVDVFSRQILENPDRPPSMLLGAWRSAVSVPLAILSGVYDTPQISPLSTSTELDDITQYRYFSRLIPSDGGTARATVEYFRSRRPDLRHMGVIYVNDAYGSAFHQAIQENALAIEPESERIAVKGSPFSYNKAIHNREEIDMAVKTLADTGYRVFFGVFYDEHYPLIMESAVKFGIAGPGYVWVISDGLSVTYLQGRSFEAGSPLAVSSQGIGILKAEGGREVPGGDAGYDRFSRAWYEQTEEMERYYNCVGHPATNTKGTPEIYYQAEPGFFRGRNLAPTAGAVFTYDTVMSMGLAACSLLDLDNKAGDDGADDATARTPSPGEVPATGSNGTQLPPPPPPPEREYFTGGELFGAFVRQRFEGASGHIEIDAATTSRDPSSAFFVLYNADGTTDEETGITTFSVDTVSHTTRVEGGDGEVGGGNVEDGAEGNTDSDAERTDVAAETEDKEKEAVAAAQSPPPTDDVPAAPAPIVWADMPGKSFVYSDGTTTFPPPLPAMKNPETNQLSPGIRGAGLALAGVIFATAAFFSCWTYHYRGVRVIRASQPMFLQMILAGSVLMGATIVTLSIDDGVASKAGCDAACQLSPWLFSYGFVISFSALFSKTWRINKIFHNPQLRRIKVTVRDVMAPFVVLFSVNTIILSVWTAVSPLTWQRSFLEGKDKFGRPVESYGSCRGTLKEWVPYVVCILVVNLSVLVLANIQAYQARSITTEYSESRYIGIIMMSLLQACFIGIPLLVLVADEPAANFFVRTGIIFVTCMSMNGLMFVPKMFHLQAWKEADKKKRAKKEERERKRQAAMDRAKAAGFRDSTLRKTFGETAVNSAAPTSSIIKTDAVMRRVSELGMGDASSDMGFSNSSAYEVSEISNKDVSMNDDEDAGSTAANKAVNDTRDKVQGTETGRNGYVATEEAFANEPAEKVQLKPPLNGGVRNNDTDVGSDDNSSACSDFSDSLSFVSDTSSIGRTSGIRIMNHPKSESRQLMVLKAQVRHMKSEKLELYERISHLQEILQEKGATDNELEPLRKPKTTSISESHRRLLLEVESDHNLEETEVPEEEAPPRPMPLKANSTMSTRLAKTVSFKFINIKNLASSGESLSSGGLSTDLRGKGGGNVGVSTNLGAIREGEEDVGKFSGGDGMCKR